MVYIADFFFSVLQNHGYINLPTSACIILMSKTYFITAKYVIKLSKVCGSSCINFETKVKVLFIMWQYKSCKFYSIMESKTLTPTSICCVCVFNLCYVDFFWVLSIYLPVLFKRWKLYSFLKCLLSCDIYSGKCMHCNAQFDEFLQTERMY